MKGLQIRRWKLLKMLHLLCTDFVKYNFVLDWHVHWYVCTAVWYVSFIIVSWYLYVTVFGFLYLSFYHKSYPHGLAPNIIFFVSYSNLSEEKMWCCDMKNLYWRLVLLFLYMKDRSAVSEDQNMHLIFFVNRPFLSSTTDDLLQISLSSLMFGDNIYVGYVLKVPPVSYFLYIK